MTSDEMTHDQHVVPQVYLEKWHDFSGRLWTLNKQYYSVGHHPAKECCVKVDYYELSKGLIPDKSEMSEYILPNFIENKYGELESFVGKQYSILLKRLDNAKVFNTRVFDTDEKSFLKKFIITMMLRNPNYGDTCDDEDIYEYGLNNYKEAMDCIFPNQDNERFMKNLIHHSVRRWDITDDLNEKDKSCLGGGLYRIALADVNKLYLYILSSDGQFLTSDTPVCLEDDFLYFPLTPNYACLYLPYHSAERPQNRVYSVTDEQIIKFNSWVIKRSTEYVYANSRELFDRFKCVQKITNVLKQVFMKRSLTQNEHNS